LAVVSTRPKRSDAKQAGQGAVVEQLVQSLEASIASGEIPVNSWLRQETMAAEFKVSRTPIREALRVLQANGMVEVLPNRGALVRGPTPRDIREAYVVRAELEGFAAELAARWIRDDELAQLREAEALFQRLVEEFLDDPKGAVAIQRGAGNARLEAAIENLHRSFPRNLTWSALSGDSRLLRDNVDEHRGIRTAIEQRDEQTARRLMTEHVQRSGELVAMWFERQAEPR
jgi:DNA-binding GntR family transcriptional regulator